MITRYFSFFDAGIEDVCRSIIDIKEPSYPVSANKSPLKIDLSCVDYGALVTKMVLWTPQKRQTSVYGNQGDGFYTLPHRGKLECQDWVEVDSRKEDGVEFLSSFGYMEKYLTEKGLSPNDA